MNTIDAQFRQQICTGYMKNINIQTSEPFVYQNEPFWSAFNLLYSDRFNYDKFKNTLDTIPRPTEAEVNAYKSSPANKITNGQYHNYDDKIFGVYKRDLPTYYQLLELTQRYETERNRHVHKGTLYYFFLEDFFNQGDYETGLLFLNKAFIEDDMKHTNTTLKFPDTPAYKYLVLDNVHTNQALHPIVDNIVHFLDGEYLTPNGYSYNAFWSSFLNHATIITSDAEAHKWFDQVIFFNGLTLKLIKNQKYYEATDSIFGEIILSNTIGDLCLLIESFSKVKLNRPGIIMNGIYPLIAHIYGWNQTPDYHSADFGPNHLETTIANILTDSYNGCSNPIQNSFYLTWGLRNTFHHNIESLAIIRKNYKEIIKKQMLFLLDYSINH